VGAVAQTFGQIELGSLLDIDGFIAPVSRRSQRLRIHITDYQRIQGD
jgi:primosomal replication protein N